MASVKSAAVSKMTRKISVNDDICVVCFKEISIRCIMDCEHTICFECSTRLRVLCDKLECPICRQETTIAVYTREKGPFRHEYMRALLNEDKYKLALEDEAVRRAFAGLLEHNCPVCPDKKRPFGALRQLTEHVHKEHKLQYCDLCIEHLKIFSWERKFYTREKLALHRRKGDPDDSSHKGHPLCEFCEKRYFDKDALFMHLRRDHFYCHLCEADGKQLFYDDYPGLADHFREEHFLCESGECVEKKFVVFRTSIDLQAHDLLEHSDSRPRRGQTLTLEFNTRGDWRRPQSAQHGGDDGRGGRRRDQRGGRARDNDRVEEERPPPPPPPPPSVDTTSTQEFPTLAGERGATAHDSARGGSLAQRVATAAGKTVRNAGARGRPWDNRAVNVTEEDFPSLGGAAGAAVAPQPAAAKPAELFSVSSRRSGKAKHQQKSSQQARPRLEDDFPSLGGASAAAPPPAKVTSVTSMSAALARDTTRTKLPPEKTRARPREDDFPSLAPLPARSAPAASVPARPKTAPVVKSAATAPTSKGTSSGGGAQKKGKGASGKAASHNNNNYTQYDFKSRASGAAAIAAAQASASAADYYDSDEEPPLPAHPARKEVQVQSSNITVARRADSPPRPPAGAPPPPPPTTDDFPSLGGRAAAPATWVKPARNKARETKPKPERRRDEQPAPMTGDEFPTLGPVAAHGNFANFVQAPSWAGDDSSVNTPTQAGAATKNQKKSKKAAKTAAPADAGSKQQNGAVSSIADGVSALSVTSAGGDARARAAVAVTRPPPGLSLRDVSPPEQWEDAVDDSDIVPGVATSSIEFEYIQPDNFANRNEKLMRTVRDIFGADFETFKTISGMFLSGSLAADEYYRSCLQRVGNDRFGKIFTELLVLMPNIDKQQELLAAHQTLNKNGFSRNKFPSCLTCRQVLVFADMAAHVQTHAENDHFPAL